MSEQSNRPQTLNTAYFRSHPRDKGLVLDFNDAAQGLDKDAGADYVSAVDYRVKSTFSSDPLVIKQRRALAETHIIATCDDEPQDNLPDITCSAMTVKPAGSMHIALPEVFDFALSRINAAAHDALKFIGPENFEKASLSLIIQRTDLESGNTHRPHVSNWHDHVSGGQNSDLVYLFHNKIGTEYKFSTHKGENIQSKELTAPDQTLARVGGEITHRPQTNQGEDVRREWGALIVNIEPAVQSRASNYRSDNSNLVKRDNPLFGLFKERAAEILAADDRLHVLDEPTTLIEYVSESPDGP